MLATTPASAEIEDRSKRDTAFSAVIFWCDEQLHKAHMSNLLADGTEKAEKSTNNFPLKERCLGDGAGLAEEEMRLREHNSPFLERQWNMNTPERITAVEVFIDRAHAEEAVAELRRHGFVDEQIGFMAPDAAEGIESPPSPMETKAEEGAATGAVAGATVGGLVGAALATAAIPGVGVVIAGGLMAGALGGAVTGLATGGIVGALVGLRIPEDEAHHYERAFHSGRTLVTVRADERYEEAVAILRAAAEKSPASGHHHTHGTLARLSETEGDSAPGAGTVF